MKVLIVDDDKLVTNAISAALQEKFQVDTAHSAKEAMKKIFESSYDVIVLDIRLPDLSGIMLCSGLRDRKNYVPILMLTGISATDQKIRAFEVGANDYLIKPFSLRELEARLAVLTRRPQNEEVILFCADLQMDTKAHTVVRSGRVITLRPKEYELLEYLLRNKNRLVTRAMIESGIWGFSTENFSNTIDVHMKHLRDALNSGFNQKLIQTIRGVGYILKAPSQ